MGKIEMYVGIYNFFFQRCMQHNIKFEAIKLNCHKRDSENYHTSRKTFFQTS